MILAPKPRKAIACPAEKVTFWDIVGLAGTQHPSLLSPLSPQPQGYMTHTVLRCNTLSPRELLRPGQNSHRQVSKHLMGCCSVPGHTSLTDQEPQLDLGPSPAPALPLG